jgi:hypothetical protein
MTDIDIDINLKSRSTFEVVDNDNYKVIFKVDIDHVYFSLSASFAYRKGD